MKQAILICMIAFTPTIFAKNQPPPPPAWDANLFSQDSQCISSHLEFLYWKAMENSLSYVLKTNAVPWNNDDTYPIGNYKNADFNIDPGFRIAMSYFRAPRYWEVWGMYTRLTSRGTAQESPPSNPNEYLDSVWTSYLSTLTQAKTWIHLNYNVADLFVDRYFNPNPHLRLRLIGGITGAWIDQNWTTRYYDIANKTTRIRNEWKFGGCGLRIGMYADWFWTSDIYLTLRGTLAALVGPYMNRVFQTTTAQPDPTYNPSLPIRNVTYRDTRSATHLQLILGPSWQKNWDPVRSELFVGYELNGWLNLQEIYHSTGANAASGPKEPWITTGVLTLQGLTTRLTLDY